MSLVFGCCIAPPIICACLKRANAVMPVRNSFLEQWSIFEADLTGIDREPEGLLRIIAPMRSDKTS